MKAEEIVSLTPGQLVKVTLHKNGYWKGIVTGRFVGIAKNGKVKVRVNATVRCYDQRNIGEWYNKF